VLYEGNAERIDETLALHRDALRKLTELLAEKESIYSPAVDKIVGESWVVS
jgi:hypothetical protein